MSGFEVAGIVLAVLPLFVEIGKALDKVSRDQELKEFYEEFWWHTYELRKQIETVVKRLPGLPEQRKKEVLDSRDLDKWGEAEDVAQALRDFFTAEDDYQAFQRVMGKVMELLARLVKDDTVHLSSSDMCEATMRSKLRRLQEARDAGGLSSNPLERLRFFKKDKDRKTCIKSLRTWNKRVHMVVESASPVAADRGEAATATVAAPAHPSSLLRTLSQRLFDTIRKSWSCDCSKKGHEARFSLASCAGTSTSPKRKTDLTEVSFDFLVSRPNCQIWGWREGTVMIKPASIKTSQHRAELQKICDVIRDAYTPEYGLQLLVEDTGGTQRLWRLNWRQSQLEYLEQQPEVSLDMVLKKTEEPPLIERRRLALVMAYSVLQLHESPWLSDRWSKERMHFFSTKSGVDLRHPYMSVSFDQFPPGGEPANLNCFHGNAGILRLGILLIEIHRWSPIEAFYTPEDRARLTPNTELHVARRVARSSMPDCSQAYRDAIDACLKVPWVPSGYRVSLEDSETQAGIFGDVVQPLECEVRLGESPTGVQAEIMRCK